MIKHTESPYHLRVTLNLAENNMINNEDILRCASCTMFRVADFAKNNDFNQHTASDMTLS